MRSDIDRENHIFKNVVEVAGGKGREMMMDFVCQCCGACCRIKDGIVRVSDEEVKRIAAYLGMSEADFIANETELAPDRKTLMLKG